MSNPIDQQNAYCVHKRTSSGDEEWSEFDDAGNEIHKRTSDGWEQWREYDDAGHEVHYRNSDGDEEWREYDTSGHEIHYRDSDGFEEWHNYDEAGHDIHYRTSDGYEYWRKYDDAGHVIHFRNSDGFEEWREFDGAGRLLHQRNSKGYEEWLENREGEQANLHDATPGDISAFLSKTGNSRFFSESLMNEVLRIADEEAVMMEMSDDGRLFIWSDGYHKMTPEELYEDILLRFDSILSGGMGTLSEEEQNEYESYRKELLFVRFNNNDIPGKECSDAEIKALFEKYDMPFNAGVVSLIKSEWEAHNYGPCFVKCNDDSVLFCLTIEDAPDCSFYLSDTKENLITVLKETSASHQNLVNNISETEPEYHDYVQEQEELDSYISDVSQENPKDPEAVLSSVVEKLGKEDVRILFRKALTDSMKVHDNPFHATKEILDEWKKTNPERAASLVEYLNREKCFDEESFGKFFRKILKEKPERMRQREPDIGR